MRVEQVCADVDHETSAFEGSLGKSAQNARAGAAPTHAPARQT
jgi:hypothetical protein